MTQSPPVWRVFFAPGYITTQNDPLLQRALRTQVNDEDLSGVWLRWTARPIFINSLGVPHGALNGFFAGAKMRNRAQATNKRYAYSLSVWVNFLASSGKEWDAADENDAMNFKYWRRSDVKNMRRISGSAWRNDLAALSTFYDWGHRVLGAPTIFDSGEVLTPKSRYGNSARASHGVDLRPATVRNADVKWLTPRAYQRWRDIGIHGLTPQGVERARWRPRSQSRDAAFVEGLYGSGLRLQEWASVLTSELHREVAAHEYASFRLADACAKGGRGHTFWLRGDVLEQLGIYKETERATAVRAAQAAGVYDEMPGRMVVEEVRKGVLRVNVFRGAKSYPTSLRINDLDPSDRRRLLIGTDEGLEPASLWINEDGLPRQKSAWYKSFALANSRVRKAGIDRLECHPHMLRHSFALRWFAVGRLVWSQQVKDMDAEHQRDLREQFGDTWSLVQTMLGHVDVNTTKGTYLEPFRALDARLLLEYGKSVLDIEPLLAILTDDPRVRTSDDYESGF